MCPKYARALICLTVPISLAGCASGSGAGRPGARVTLSDLPAFPDPALQSYEQRLIGDKQAWDRDPAGFMVTIDGDSTCDLPAGRAEDLVLGMPRDKYLKIMADNGFKASITSIGWRVLAGECPDGLLEGSVRFRADYTLRYRNANIELTTTSKILTEAIFSKGQLAGPLARYVGETSNTVGGIGEVREIEYATMRGKELVGKGVKFRLIASSMVGIQTWTKEAIEPGLYKSDLYNGPNPNGYRYEQDGLPHGDSQIRLAFGTEKRQCHNMGVRVAQAACDGYRVNAALATPVDQEGNPIPGATPPTQGARQQPIAAAPAAGAGPAIPSAGGLVAPSNSPWPDLAAAMPRIGGGENDAAVIVGVENYAFVPKVGGAAKNAKDWYRYFTRVRGTSPGKVRLLLDNDATDVGLRSAVEEAAKLTSAGGTLWFVFIGHGAPSADQKDGLLVGVDAQQSAQGLYGRSVAQKDLLKLASVGKQKQSVFVVDACFSGRTDSGAAIASGLQPLIAIKTDTPEEANALVFTAGKADQFAGPLPRLDRPAFSYLMLGGLLGWGDVNGNGEVSAVELADYSADTLRAVLNGRNQTPEVTPRKDVALARSAGVRGPDVAGIAVGD